MTRKLVVIGAGMASGRALEHLLDTEFGKWDVTLFGAEPRGNYNRIMLSPVLSGEKTYEEIVTHDAQWYADHGVTCRFGEGVTGIDRERKVFTTARGETPYDKLLVATGSTPFIIPMPGHDLDGVLAYRDLDDTQAMIDAAAKPGARAVVIGGGLLGLEAAAGLHLRGAHVTVVHLPGHLMERQLDEAAGYLLRRELTGRGIDVLCGANSSEILGEDGHVTALRLEDGTDPRRTHARGAEREAAEMLKTAIAAGGAPETQTGGSVALVGAGAGRRDLITMRGVQRLQEADIVFHDRLIDPGVLEYARRDAERVCVGKAPGAHPWPQGKIDGLLVAAARQGKRVVRLKCGDPGVFARGAEEVAALASAGIPCEIVPGVTAACVAAASAGTILTERGRTDALVMATGTCRSGDAPSDMNEHLRPGTTLALYMAVQTAPTIRRDLLAAGHPPATPVEIVANADREDMRVVATTLGALADTMAGQAIANPAIILIRRPKAAARETGATVAA